MSDTTTQTHIQVPLDDLRLVVDAFTSVERDWVTSEEWDAYFRLVELVSE